MNDCMLIEIAQALVVGGSGLLAINQSNDTSNKPSAVAGIPQRRQGDPAAR